MAKPKPIPFDDPTVLEGIQAHFKNVILTDNVRQAYGLVRNLEIFWKENPNFETENLYLHKAYLELYTQARFLAIPLLKEKEIVGLLRANFADCFKIPDYDIWRKVKQKLIALPVLYERNDLKLKIRGALTANKQVLTAASLVIDEERISGTTENWMRDYVRNLGPEPVSTVKLAEYFVSGPNTKRLNEKDRNRLKKLFHFYEQLKLSSVTPEGIEEKLIVDDEGVLKILEGTRFEEVVKPDLVKRVKQAMEALEKAKREVEEERGKPEAVRARYLGDPKEHEAVAKEKEEIKKATKLKIIKLRDYLYNLIVPAPGKKPDKIKVAAVLLAIAEIERLDNILEEDKRFRNLLLDFYRKGERTADIEGLKISPTAPKFVSAFLQLVLKDIVGLNENESARIGVHLSNIMKKENEMYGKMAYYDVESDGFKWAR